MKILLLNPPSLTGMQYIKEGRCEGRATPEIWPPTTLASISSLLKKSKSYDIDLVDGNFLNLNKPQLTEIYEKYSPDVIVYNTTTPSFLGDLKSAKIAKDHNKNVINIMFGTHVTPLAEEIIEKYDYIDFIIKNEPETITFNLIEAIRKKKDLRTIKGITYRKNNKAYSTPKEEFIQDLDSLPFPDRELLDNDLYINPLTGRKYTVVRSSRGCPYKCKFCTWFYYGAKWRTRSPKNIFDELKECVEKYNIKDFLFAADTFTLNKEKLIELCKLILDNNLDIKWICNSRINTIDEEKLFWMKKAGCILISFGIESGNPEILKRVNKQISLEQARKSIQLTKEAKIKSVAYFVFGLPGENKKTVKTTIKFAKKLNPDYVAFFTAVPYPGTDFYDYLKENNFIKTHDWTRYDEAQCDVYDLPELSAKDLLRFSKKAYLSFYLNPKKLMQKAFECRSLDEIKNNFNIFKSHLQIWFKKTPKEAP